MAENEAIPFDAKYSKDLGCYLVAKNDIPAGEVFFTEPPLFFYSLFEKTAKNDKILLCTCCYRVIAMEYAVHCKRCRWPFCSKECTKDPVHTNLECDIFRRGKVKRTPNSLRFLYLVRCFQMKKREKAKWAALNNLCCTTSTKKKNPEYCDSVESMAKDGASFLRSVCHMDVDKKEIKKIINIFEINSFSMDIDCTEFPEMEESVSVVYAISCLISHGCASNTEWNIISADGWSMELYSRVAIEKGVPVRISYTSEAMSCGLTERRSLLYQYFGFICQCERCLDPTELGTFYSTLKCPRCPKGALHPSTSQSHKHRCRKCTFSITQAQVAWVEGSFVEQLEQISKSTDKGSRLEKLEELITKATSRYGLHPNHFLVHKATTKWLQTVDKDVLLEDGEESLKTYHNILLRTKPILKTLRLFGASTSRQLALESMIVSAITRYHFKSSDYVEIVHDIEDLKEKMKIITKILKHLSRGVGSSKYLSCYQYGSLTEEMKKEIHLWRSRLKECQQELLASQRSGNSQDSDEGPSYSAHSSSARSHSSLHHN